jgi:tetratricopeptide (TPR) repeat protein
MQIKPLLVAVGAIGALILIARSGCTGEGSDVPLIRTAPEFQATLERARGLSEAHMAKFDAGEALTEAEKADLRKASKLFEGLVGFEPRRYQPHFGLGKIEFTLGNREKALRHLQQAVLSAPRDLENNELARLTVAEARYLSSLLYFEFEDWPRARDEGRAAYVLVPQSSLYATAWAAAEMQLGEEDEAIRILRIALLIDPENERAQQLLAFLEQ